MREVLLIGAGNMGFAMLRAWTELIGYRFAVIEVSEELRQRAEQAGTLAYANAADLPADYEADIVVIATKPQMVADAIAVSRGCLRAAGMVVSVAAGVTIGELRRCVGEGPVIVRAMPNTPAAIGEGMTVCCLSTNAHEPEKNSVHALLSGIGRVAFVEDEDLMDAVTAVSGSGPAYVFHLLEVFTNVAASLGLPRDLADVLAKQTVYGAAKLAVADDVDPSVLREQVTSPNGTTAAALEVLMNDNGGLTLLLQRTIEAAACRSRELGG